MSQRSSYRNTNSDPDFDLDSYIREKANEEPSFQDESQYNENTGGSFLKNVSIIVFSAIMILLYFNNWSPKQVLSNVFGFDGFQQTAQTQDIPPVPLPPTPQETEPTAAEQEIAAAELSELERVLQEELQQELNNSMGPEQQQALEEAFAQLSEQMATLFESEEFQQIQVQGFQAAAEALQNLEIQGISGTDQRAIEEAIQSLEEAGISMSSENALGMSFSEYRNEIVGSGELGEDQVINLLDLYFAEVPVEYIKEQQEMNSEITYQEILEKFNQEG